MLSAHGDWLRNYWTPDWRVDTILTLVQNTNTTNQKTARFPLQSHIPAAAAGNTRWQQLLHGQEWVGRGTQGAAGGMPPAASDMQCGEIESRMEYIETTEQTSC